MGRVVKGICEDTIWEELGSDEGETRESGGRGDRRGDGREERSNGRDKGD